MILTQRDYVLETLERYWPENKQLIKKLPIPIREIPENEELPPQGVLVKMPDWASHVLIDGSLLVPRWASEQASNSWNQIDWIAVCFWYLNNLAERAYEDKYGPIHSYSFRLKGWDKRFWERAWVNRIALFLRKWASQKGEQSEDAIFGYLPKPEILLTHDVDAIKKTMAIRFKQSVFHSFNAVRALFKLQPFLAFNKLYRAFLFFFSTEDYWCFEKIKEIESNNGLRSYFNFYAGPPGNKRTLGRRLIDPAYDVSEERLSREITILDKGGWTIGLHQAFGSWKDPVEMVKEKENLEQVLGLSVKTCRQHWLRFSFNYTWEAQQKAGFEHDTTLGFNDRPAFRNGTALTFHPWSPKKQSPLKLTATPMMLMDSHLYDYQEFSDKQRKLEINRWLDEVAYVHGSVTLIWHQHVMNRDYGWSSGYKEIVNWLKKGISS